MKICVVGTGYVGISLAVLLAQKYEVVALDISKDRVESINKKNHQLKILNWKIFLRINRLI